MGSNGVVNRGCRRGDYKSPKPTRSRLRIVSRAPPRQRYWLALHSQLAVRQHFPPCGRKTTMISSRTTTGIPRRCPLCSTAAVLESAELRDDVPCPHCGVRLVQAAVLLTRLQALARQHPGLELTEITADSPWPLGGDSLTAVEVMLALEQDLGVTISAHDAERIYTVGEAIRYFQQRLRRRDTDGSAKPSRV